MKIPLTLDLLVSKILEGFHFQNLIFRRVVIFITGDFCVVVILKTRDFCGATIFETGYYCRVIIIKSMDFCSDVIFEFHYYCVVVIIKNADITHCGMLTLSNFLIFDTFELYLTQIIC